MSDSPDPLLLFKRNGIVNTNGQLGGVLKEPPNENLIALREAVAALVIEGQERGVMLRVGVLQLNPREIEKHEVVLVYVIDVGGPHDEYGFIRRLAEILIRHGTQQLEQDLGMDRVYELARYLWAAEP